MKKFILLTAMLVFTGLFNRITAQTVGINDDGSQPNNSAMLDIKSTTKGMMIPRVNLTSTTSALPVTTPATSLLVYNLATAGDVTPGFYFWNGSAWARIDAAGAHQLTIVTKTATGPLSKTENMVFASGNITLTLPALATADSGLEISVKNVGTYTDLVTVVGNGGVTIDGNTSSSLTRWRGKTYVARGGRWIIKEKERRIDNLLEVSAEGSWTTIAEVVAFLNAHMTTPCVVRLGGGIYNITSTQTINLPYPVTFEGLSYGEATLHATAAIGANPMFSCATECYFKMLVFDGALATNDGIRLTGNGTYYEIKDCSFSGFTRAVAITGNADVWLFENDISNATGAGIEVNAPGASITKISETDFMNCAKGINLASSVGAIVSIQNCGFYNSAGQTGIIYVPASFTSFVTMYITSNTWNNTGTFMNGFDFTRSDGRDAKAYVENNAGMETESPHCKVNVVDNVGSTTCTVANTYYKALFINTSSFTCKWTIANNRLTYQPQNQRDVVMNLAGSITDDNSNHNLTVAIAKNGSTATVYGPVTVRVTNSSGYYTFATVVYLQDVGLNDYFEIFVQSNNAGDVVTISDLNWYTDSK